MRSTQLWCVFLAACGEGVDDLERVDPDTLAGQAWRCGEDCQDAEVPFDDEPASPALAAAASAPLTARPTPPGTLVFERLTEATESWPELSRRSLRARPFSPDDELFEDPNQPTTRPFRPCTPLPECIASQLVDDGVTPALLLFDGARFRPLTPPPEDGRFEDHVVLIDAVRSTLDDLHAGPGLLEVTIDGPRVSVCRRFEQLALATCTVADFARGEVLFDRAHLDRLAHGAVHFVVPREAVPSRCSAPRPPPGSAQLVHDAPPFHLKAALDVSGARSTPLEVPRLVAQHSDETVECARWPTKDELGPR